MIKKNESNVANTDFKLPDKRDYKFLCLALFGNFKELFKTLWPDVQLSRGLDQTVAF